MLQDFRYALSLLTHSRGFTAVAVLSLAITIGANTTVFSLLNALAFRAPLAERPHELVSIYTRRAENRRDYRAFSHAEYTALRSANPVFTAVTGVGFAFAAVGPAEEPRRSFVLLTDENYLSVFGVAPLRGRFFTAEESRPGAGQPVAFASYAAWERAGRPADYVGRQVAINGTAHTVVGVAPDGFSGGSAAVAPEYWVPLGMYEADAGSFGRTGPRPLAAAGHFALTLVGRLRAPLTVDSAAGPLAGLARTLAAQAPEDEYERALLVRPLSRFSFGSSPQNEPPIAWVGAVFLGLSACVLLIACLNLSNMFLARGAARRREFAIRLSLGASRARVVRQLLVEAFLLTLLGGALGLLFSQWGAALLVATFRPLLPVDFAFILESRPDPAVLLVTLGFCLAATVIASLGPALRQTRGVAGAALRAQAGSSETEAGSLRLFAGRNLLIIAQTSLALMLLFGSGLFLRGALNAAAADPGFTVADRYVAELDLGLSRLPAERRQAACAAVVDSLAAAPGVAGVGLTSQLPYSNNTTERTVTLAAEAGEPRHCRTLFSEITPGYFGALGLPLRRGRLLSTADETATGDRRFAVVDESFVAAHLGAADPLGRLLEAPPEANDGRRISYEIVGVVGNHRHNALEKTPRANLFVLSGPAPLAQQYLVVALAPGAAANSAPVLTEIRQRIRAAAPDLPVFNLRPAERLIATELTLFVTRLGAVAVGFMGAVALVLAVVGVYGVKSYAVANRTREIGIRLAIGARPADVFRLVFGQSVAQVAIALILGLGLAAAAGRGLSALLYDVNPWDPLCLSVTVLVLGLATGLATWIPARRATRVPPLVALRAD